MAVSNQSADENTLDREWLRSQASACIPRRLASKLDVSDVVQEACLNAHKHKSQFRGKTDAERRAWKLKILRNVVRHRIRDYKAKRRDVARERQIVGSVDSSANHGPCLAAEQSTPSQRAQREEDKQHLLARLGELPEEQRTALIYAHQENLKREEIARRMGLTVGAVNGLLGRGMNALRSKLKVQDV